jgi:hypothetical protein
MFGGSLDLDDVADGALADALQPLEGRPDIDRPRRRDRSHGAALAIARAPDAKVLEDPPKREAANDADGGEDRAEGRGSGRSLRGARREGDRLRQDGDAEADRDIGKALDERHPRDWRLTSRAPRGLRLADENLARP